MRTCHACGQMLPFEPGRDEIFKPGDRVRALIAVQGSQGPEYPTRCLAPMGEAGTVVGQRWPKGYAVDFDNGASVIVAAEGLHKIGGGA